MTHWDENANEQELSSTFGVTGFGLNLDKYVSRFFNFKSTYK